MTVMKLEQARLWPRANVHKGPMQYYEPHSNRLSNGRHRSTCRRCEATVHHRFDTRLLTLVQFCASYGLLGCCNASWFDI